MWSTIDMQCFVYTLSFTFSVRHTRARKWYNNLQQIEKCARKNSNQNTQGSSVFVGCCKRKMGPKKVSVPPGNGEDVPTHHQEKSLHHNWWHICTVPDQALTNWKQSSERTICTKATQENCGVKNSSTWSSKSPQIENALVWFRNWFCMCWNEHPVVTSQFPPLFWWEKLKCCGLEGTTCHKSAWCFKCLLVICATQFILFRSALPIWEERRFKLGSPTLQSTAITTRLLIYSEDLTFFLWKKPSDLRGISV